MTTLDTTNLENIANLDFGTFVALHSQGQNPASSYAHELQLGINSVGRRIGRVGIHHAGQILR